MLNGKLFSEIFEEFKNENTREGKINVLRKHDHPRLRQFFQLLFSPRIQFDVDVPNYRPAIEPAGLNWTYMEIEIPKLYRFIVNHPQRQELTPEKKRSLLAVVLESLHKDDAVILVNLLKKDLGIKYLNPNIVSEAYPGIDLS